MAKAKAKRGTLYLYADGHAVQLWDERHPQAGIVEWAESIEEYGPRIYSDFQGRIVFYDRSGLGQLAKTASGIRIHANNGSEVTRAKGIAVVSLTLMFHDKESITFNDMPGLISGEFSYQPGIIETFDPEAIFWGTTKIAKITRKKTAQPITEGA